MSELPPFSDWSTSSLFLEKNRLFENRVTAGELKSDMTLAGTTLFGRLRPGVSIETIKSIFENHRKLFNRNRNFVQVYHSDGNFRISVQGLPEQAGKFGEYKASWLRE